MSADNHVNYISGDVRQKQEIGANRLHFDTYDRLSWEMGPRRPRASVCPKNAFAILLPLAMLQQLAYLPSMAYAVMFW